MKHRTSSGAWADYPQSFSETDREDLLRLLEDHTSITMRQVADGHTEESLVAIRHDIDHNLEEEFKFAQWEHRHGIRATYFILTDSWYFAEQDVRAVIHDLELMGHEVGYHHNALVQASGDIEAATRIFHESLEALEAFGARLSGCAAHGGSNDINNLDIWNHCDVSTTFGLEYEAYHLHRSSNYISDNRGTWRAPLEHVEGKQTHLLIHPCHWPLTS